MNVILESFYKSHKVKKIVITLITCWLFLSLHLVPTAAEIKSSIASLESKADIVLDGRKLFEIGNSGDFLAAQRAKKINSFLQNKLKQYPSSTQKLNVSLFCHFPKAELQ